MSENPPTTINREAKLARDFSFDRWICPSNPSRAARLASLLLSLSLYPTGKKKETPPLFLVRFWILPFGIWVCRGRVGFAEFGFWVSRFGCRNADLGRKVEVLIVCFGVWSEGGGKRRWPARRSESTTPRGCWRSISRGSPAMICPSNLPK